MATTWNINADGDWNTAANWSTAALPGAGDDVTIDTADFHTVTYSSGASTIQSLTVGNDALAITAGSLAITGSATISNGLNLSGGTLTVSNGGGTDISMVTAFDMSGSGTLSLLGGEFDAVSGGTLIPGAITLAAGTVFHLGVDIQHAPAFDLVGSGTFGSAGSLIEADSVVLNLTANLTIDSNFDLSFSTLNLGSNNLTINGFLAGLDDAPATGTFENSGVLTLAGGIGEISLMQIEGHGRTVLQNHTTIGSDDLFVGNGQVLENQGLLTFRDTDLILGFQQTSSGTFENDMGATVEAVNEASGFDLFSNVGPTTFKNAGRFINSGAGHGTISVSVNNTGTILVKQGELDIDGQGTAAGVISFVNSGSVSVNHGQLDVVGHMAGTGTVKVASGATFILDASETSRANTANITSGIGVVHLTGGSGDDTFRFGSNFRATDVINGGAGNDTVVLNGHASAAFSAETMTNVENISLARGFDYRLITHDRTVAFHASLAVDGSSLAASNTLLFNGAPETNGRFSVAGGAGNDVLTGGNGNDVLSGRNGADRLTGGKGADILTGGLGADRFVYKAAGDSTGAAHDTIGGFNTLNDALDLTHRISGIDDKIVLGNLSAGKFDSGLASAVNADHLGAHHAVVFTPDSGTLAGAHFLIVDMNGIAGYQANADLVIQLTSPVHLGQLSVDNFI